MSHSEQPMDYPCIVPYDARTRAEWIEWTVPREEYETRIARTRDEMRRTGLDGLLVTGSTGDPGGIAYLTNYTPRFGNTWLLLPLEGEPVALTDAMLHGEPMHSMLWNVWLDDLRPASARPGSPPGTLSELCAGAIRELRLDRGRVGVYSPATLSMAHGAALRAALPGVDWADGTLAALRPRAIKSANEIAYMRRACEITALGLEAAEAASRPGASEREIANAAHAAMFEAGCEELGFDTAVSSGPRAGLKHAAPTARRVQDGELLFLDMGAVVAGYHADMSRCVVAGTAGPAAQVMLNAAAAIFEETLAAVRPGNSVRDIYRAAEQAAQREGMADDYMPNGLGHGLGLSLWELPFLSPNDETVLEPGMIFALEPMLVRYGAGTAVVEETVLVTASGGEPLSGRSANRR
ncbi:MAG TPA: Xaa-Pro peptidase family protein [Thermomicrobiales bacterium]|nr:Xaa-Pro peptidase family protein [Thermomicrobiales bacterium]